MKIESKKLTGQNIIWLQLLVTKSDPKFLRKIKQLGFERCQKGVYQRFQLKELVSEKIAAVKSAIGSSGVRLHILQFTDEQYGNIITLS